MEVNIHLFKLFSMIDQIIMTVKAYMNLLEVCEEGIMTLMSRKYKARKGRHFNQIYYYYASIVAFLKLPLVSFFLLQI